MAENKKAFIVYTDWKKYLDGLNESQAGKWIKWMFEYCNDKWKDKDTEIEYPKDAAVKMLCLVTKDILKRDLKKYEDKKNRILKNGKQYQTDIGTKSDKNNIEINTEIETDIETEIGAEINTDIRTVNSNKLLVNSNKLLNNKDNTMSSKLNDVCREIIEYLNLKTGKHYKSNSKATLDFIKARLNDKYTVDDFKHVIDVKCQQWMNTEHEKYLRPETLFRPSHFESYLNEQISKYDTGNYDISDGFEEL